VPAQRLGLQVRSLLLLAAPCCHLLLGMQHLQQHKQQHLRRTQ
jgi:hypothetical protein